MSVPPLEEMPSISETGDEIEEAEPEKDMPQDRNSSAAADKPSQPADDAAAAQLPRRSDASAQISMTGAPWARSSPEGSGASGGATSGASLPMPPARAPWADSGGSGNGTGGGVAATAGAARPLPMAPTRAPWADTPVNIPMPGSRADPEGGSLHGGGPSGGGFGSSGSGSLARSGSGGGGAPSWQPRSGGLPAPQHHPPNARNDVEVDIEAEAAMPADPLQLQNQEFKRPQKRIHSPNDLARFLKGRSARSFVSFILALNEAVRGKRLSEHTEASPAVETLLQVLEKLSAWVDQIPAVSQSLRYGNPAFRTWHAKVSAAAPELMRSLLPPEAAAAATELGPFLSDSLGNATRIDYGTGHETTFAALLYCLARVGVFAASDAQALVMHVFARYLELMRKVQKTYWLEPAGSHGVWGLDDYQFLPFVWGSSQLIGHTAVRPSSIHCPEALATYAQDYLYLSCVQFVKEVKKGPLAETSPMLNDISGVPGWARVNAGMIKMYQAEVLSKFPIMQHFLFGSLLPFDEEEQQQK